jgi:hypothetical protein
MDAWSLALKNEGVPEQNSGRVLVFGPQERRSKGKIEKVM